MSEACVWTLLATGLVLHSRGAQRNSHLWAAVTGALGLTLLAVLIGTSAAADSMMQATTTGLAMLWVLGFGWLAWPESAAATSPTAWGRMWLAAAGLVFVGSASDLVTLGLVWELIRRATWSDESARMTPLDWLPAGLFWLGLAAWLSITGTLSLNELPRVLTALGARGAEPPLAAVIGAALMLLGLLGGSWTAVFAAVSDEDARWPQHVAQLTARSLAQSLLLVRLAPVLSAAAADAVAAVLIVVSLAAAVAGFAGVGRRQRWDRWMLAAWWQQSFLQMALVVPALLRHAPETTMSVAPVVGLELAGLIHGLVALAGLTAAAWGLGTGSRAPVFSDELLGAGRQQPGLTAAAVIALGSLVGVPFLCGGWLRLVWCLMMWDTPMSKPGDVVGPHQGSIVLAIVGAGMTIVLSIAWGQLLRLTLCEPPVRSHHQGPGRWPRAVAITAGVILLATGLWPDVWTQWLTPWIRPQ